MQISAKTSTSTFPYIPSSSIAGNAVEVEQRVKNGQNEKKEIGGQARLSEEEKRVVRELKRRDREVRRHESAHIAAGGQYVKGGAQYEYQKGPDGRRYAVGGEVSIDTSPVKGNPEKTIKKMQIVRKAALAPAKPSAKDRAVAAKASMEANKARMELQQENIEESKASDETSFPHSTNSKRIISYTNSAVAVNDGHSVNNLILDLVA